MRKLINKRGKFSPLVLLVLIFSPILLALISLSVGRIYIPIKDIFKLFSALVNKSSYDLTNYSLIINIRLPRIILAILVGSSMAGAGVTYQSLFSNPLATPDILGVTSATCLGAVIGILLSFNMFLTQVLGLFFGIFAVFLTVFLGSTKRRSVIDLILSGIIISSIFNAIISLIKYTADPLDKLPEITYWLLGSFARASYINLAFGFPFIIIGVIMIFIMRFRLNILSLSKDEAKSMGLNIKKTNLYFILATTMITAGAVSMCGQIGWIGLIIPHLARLMVGSNNTYVLPLSLSLGASFMLLIEILSRSLSVIELPLQALTALIGAPIFIILLRKNQGGFI